MKRRIRALDVLCLLGACCAAGLALSSCGGGGGGASGSTRPARGTVIALIRDAQIITTSDNRVVSKIFVDLQKVEILPTSGASVTLFDASAPGNQVQSFDLLTLQTIDFFAGVASAPDSTYTGAILTLAAARFEEAGTQAIVPLMVPGPITITITPPLDVNAGQVSLIEFDMQPFIIAVTGAGPTTYRLAPAITATPVPGSNGRDVDGIGLKITSVDCMNARLDALLDDNQPVSVKVDISRVPPALLTDSTGTPIACGALETLVMTTPDVEAEVQGVFLANGDIVATAVTLQDTGNGQNGNNQGSNNNGSFGSGNGNGNNNQVNDEYLGTIAGLTLTGPSPGFDLLGARVAPLHVNVDASTIVLDDRPGATTRRLTLADLLNGQTAEVEGDPVTPGTTSPILATQIELK